MKKWGETDMLYLSPRRHSLTLPLDWWDASRFISLVSGFSIYHYNEHYQHPPTSK